ncbi:MAG: alpha/beta hydrolase [Planctomycetes bacterium]|nr:alpha/beta hydrolase [Planctomycetota bacterium]
MTPVPRALATLGLLASLACSLPAQVEPFLTLADVAYGPYADPDRPHSAERLDFYAHPDAQAPQPVLIEIHPGAFFAGAKSDFTTYLADAGGLDAIDKAFAAGFAVVSIDYPLVAPALLPDGQPNPDFPKNKYPRAAHSVRRAIQFVRSKAGEWNLDPQRVFVIGSSAGGHLGLWAAMTKDIGKPKSGNPVAQQSSRPDGVVFLSTPTYLDAAHLQLPPGELEVASYFGKASQEALGKAAAQKKALAASPAWRATHAKGGPKTSPALVQLNVAMPLLGVYSNLDVGATSSSYALPVADPHSAVFGLLLREALDEYALQAQDPAAQWVDLTLLNANAGLPGAAGEAADAVVAWLLERAGLPQGAAP